MECNTAGQVEETKADAGRDGLTGVRRMLQPRPEGQLQLLQQVHVTSEAI